MQGRPSKPALTLAEAHDSARASGHATRTRTRELSAEARGALRVAAAAVAVGAPVVAGGAGAAPRGRPVAGLHRHQGLACGRQRHGCSGCSPSASRNPRPASNSPAAWLRRTVGFEKPLPVLALKHPSGAGSLPYSQKLRVLWVFNSFKARRRIKNWGVEDPWFFWLMQNRLHSFLVFSKFKCETYSEQEC